MPRGGDTQGGRSSDEPHQPGAHVVERRGHTASAARQVHTERQRTSILGT